MNEGSKALLCCTTGTHWPCMDHVEQLGPLFEGLEATRALYTIGSWWGEIRAPQGHAVYTCMGCTQRSVDRSWGQKQALLG